MAFETFNKSGQHGSKRVFNTESFPSTWDDGNREKRDYMKSGVSSVVRKGEGSYKFKSAKASPGNTSKRDYMKSGNKAQAGFGTKCECK